MRTLGAVVCLWGAAAAGAAGSQAGAPPDPGDGLGTGDVVRIAVYDQEQLSGLYTVEADGSFAFPPLGRIVVGGMTLRSLEELLTTRLADGHLQDPRVRAAVETLRSRRVFVIGEIANPGVFPLLGDMTLVEALAAAGSRTERASHEVILMRPASGAVADGSLLAEPEAADTIRVDLRDLQRGIARHGGVPLRNGDTVIVPRAPTQRVFVIGEIANPGVFPLLGDMTLVEALAAAGSRTERASHEVILMRPASGAAADGSGLLAEPEAADTIRVDLRDLQRGIARHGGVPLRNGDTVIVPRAPTIFVRGAVRNPGEYPLRRNDLTVSQVLARAGGGTWLGALDRIRALRIVDGEPREVRLELSDVVRPDDTIVVPRRFF